ncbi:MULTISPECIES: AfsR/SARP family transcriptional regulator [Amycolatopsis]
MQSTLDIRILGPLSASAGNRILTPSAPKERHLFGLLLTQHEKVVSLSRIVDELWLKKPSKSAVTAVQTYILKIRRQLASALAISGNRVRAEILQTHNRGYLFDTSQSRFDLAEFDRLTARGSTALDAGDHAKGVRLLAAAEQLWRGLPLLDVDQGPMLQAEVARIEQTRSNARIKRVETQLHIGQFREVLAELSGLVVEHPFDEHLHGYYMIALQRAGRRQDALRVFHGLRKSMTEELGIEPSAELQLLQRRVLDANGTSPIEPTVRHSLLHQLYAATGG